MHVLKHLSLWALVCLLAGMPNTSFGQEDLDTDGLDTEPGLRLQVYWIGNKFNNKNARLAVQPSASANVDLTVPGVAVKANAVF